MKSITQPTSTSHESQLSSSMKYNGLLEIPLSKRIKNYFFALMSYLDQVTKPYSTIHNIISLIRLLQLFGPSLCSGSMEFWENNSLQYKTLGILSIFYQLFPNFSQEACGPYICYGFAIISFLFLSIFFGIALSYQKQAKLSPQVATILSCFIFSVLYLIIPIFTTAAGEMISRLINFWKTINKSIYLSSVIIGYIMVILISQFYESIVMHSILFRPNSLLCVQDSCNIFVLFI